MLAVRGVRVQVYGLEVLTMGIAEQAAGLVLSGADQGVGANLSEQAPDGKEYSVDNFLNGEPPPKRTRRTPEQVVQDKIAKLQARGEALKEEAKARVRDVAARKIAAARDILIANDLNPQLCELLTNSIEHLAGGSFFGVEE